MIVDRPVDFGYLEWDGQRLWFKETHEPLPMLWQRCSETPMERRDPRWQISYEGVLPLENGLSAWLFCERKYPLDVWEVQMALWVPCPLHAREPDARRCEYPALPYGEGVVTHPEGCEGTSCSGCWHDRDHVPLADPGDRAEFWDALRAWSALRYKPRPDLVPEHQDHLLWCRRHGIDA